MTELSFAKSFLTTLDSRPTKLSLEHVEDPHAYPARGAYTLPKMARPMTKRQKLAPGKERAINITLKSLRNPPLDIVLKSQSLLISILDVKTGVSNQARIPVEKIKILHKKKPVGDAKVLKDLVGEEDASVEFSIMVMGGAASVGKDDNLRSVPVAVGPGAEKVVATKEFWKDLQGFLTQRLRDEQEGKKAFEIFRNAWESDNSGP